MLHQTQRHSTQNDTLPANIQQPCIAFSLCIQQTCILCTKNDNINV
ncbi:hypothetical protein HAL013_06990 [Helicobacter ailurogastricus]|uniref:Uncharacterized protein n=1 Tax=Helicobacter ailurogastricus TaxID=1578720 RepID=A0A0K2X8W2_9HELI|nr:hypothetical protein HAL011_07200 [Helicobacter ailurogastricus]CRF42511.1 hypothetical protein HAL013_06990 [Helicobacter ailurogastricus]CRF44183.1 hypothetical protein HAL09_07560 [Helicobacter ailurogastricus]